MKCPKCGCEVMDPFFGEIPIHNVSGCHGIGHPAPPVSDPVNHPAHYTAHPSGVECIQITEHMNMCIGNAMKYLWRADLKHDAIEDLKKAAWYIEREIARRSQP